VPPLAIVENLNVLENVVPGFVAGLVVAMMHQLGFQCVEKTFHRRVLASLALTGSQQFPLRLIEQTMPCSTSRFW
jgi:hypothetical protein